MQSRVCDLCARWELNAACAFCVHMHCARYVSLCTVCVKITIIVCVYVCVCVCACVCVCVCVCEHRPAFSTGANTELLGGDGHECRTNSCDVVNCVCISSH